MNRWRTVALVDVPTTDGRVIRGTVTSRPAPLPLLKAPAYKPGTGHVGASVVGRTEVRVRGNRIQARLPWRYRHANLDTHPGSIEWHDELADPPGLMVLCDPEIVALTVAGPNPWAELQ